VLSNKMMSLDLVDIIFSTLMMCGRKCCLLALIGPRPFFVVRGKVERDSRSNLFQETASMGKCQHADFYSIQSNSS